MATFKVPVGAAPEAAGAAETPALVAADAAGLLAAAVLAGAAGVLAAAEEAGLAAMLVAGLLTAGEDAGALLAGAAPPPHAASMNEVAPANPSPAARTKTCRRVHILPAVGSTMFTLPGSGWRHHTSGGLHTQLFRSGTNHW
ncbi:MAG TPA: hypothetical protein VFS62_14605 [Chloroflexota bacterium]|nr:hypothetical protein [Chloroflexota bacterium]